MKPHKLRILLIIFLSIGICTTSLADHFSFFSTYDVCFTPGENCAGKIVREIDHAKKTILVQAYSFTDTYIATALVQAKRRGIDVKVVLDKSQFKSSYTVIPFLKNNRIPIFIDNKPAIAHNKIIIIDNKTVIGGSYNYTKSAAKRNAENVIIIKDRGVAHKYKANWYKRERFSLKLN